MAKYDSTNKDALLKWNLQIQSEGQVAGNKDYRHLVVPQPANTLSAEVKAKIEELREEGIIIIDKPYQAKDFSVWHRTGCRSAGGYGLCSPLCVGGNRQKGHLFPD